MTYLPIVVVALLAQHSAMPPGMTHEEHLAQIEKEKTLKARGAIAMGFDQNSTTHHFMLTGDGGTIDVGVNDAFDTVGRDAIRSHLRTIASAFSRGDFGKPFATHGEVPPGVKTMRQRVGAIEFRYEDTSGGGRVVIRTTDRRAKSAVQEFLRYQIKEHATSGESR
jgi:hypothetical protein